MPLDFSKLNDEVNGNNGGTPAAAPAVVVEAPEQIDYAGQLACANQRIQALEQERAEQDEAVAKIRMKAIADAAAKPLQRVPAAEQDLAYARAVREIGNAKFHQLSDADRCKYLGITDSQDIPTELCERYFGPRSKSLDAAQLQRTNPNFYSKLRAVSKARGLL
jgi:hypothetical protein